MKFARFLAKIAHGLAVAKFGTEFFNPWLQEIILGREERFHPLCRWLSRSAASGVGVSNPHGLLALPILNERPGLTRRPH